MGRNEYFHLEWNVYIIMGQALNQKGGGGRRAASPPPNPYTIFFKKTLFCRQDDIELLHN